MKNNTIVSDDLKYIDDSVFEYIKNYTIADVDLYVTIAGTIGAIGQVPHMFNNMNLTENAVKLTNIQVDKLYLMYALSSATPQAHFTSKYHQTAQPKLSIETLSATFIPLPPLAEQRCIVGEIEKWFTLIDDLEANKQDLQAAIRQVHAKVLDLAIHGKLVPQDPNDEPAIDLLHRINPHFAPSDTSHYQNVPQGWEVLKVGEVADYINGRAFKPEEWEQQGLPIIRIQNLNNENAAYNYSTTNFEDKYLVHKGDLLFAWAASLGTYIWNKGDAWLNQHIFKVIPKSFIQKEFLYYSFIVMIGDFYAESHGSGMVHITKGKFENRPILIPPIAEQKRIVSKIEEILSVIDAISAEL